MNFYGSDEKESVAISGNMDKIFFFLTTKINKICIYCRLYSRKH